MNSRDKTSSEPATAKKPYRKPTLEIYGDIADITQNVGMTGAPDGGKGNDKTKP